MSMLLLTLLSCSTEAPVRRFHVTASYGSYEVVGMAGTGIGTLHGYLVDGQFGLPTLAVELGDTIEITLQNDTFESMGLHPHGVHYDIDNDGISRLAAPGESVTYTWEATEGAGTFLYHSHQMDSSGYEYQAEAGILGALVVLDPKEPAPDEMVTYLMMAAYEPWTETETGTLTPVEEAEPAGTSATSAASGTAPPSAPAAPGAPGPTTTALPEEDEADCPRESEILVPGDDADLDLPPDGYASGVHPGSDTGTGDTSASTGHSHGTGGSTLGTHNHMLVVQSVSGAGWLDTDTRESNVSEAALGDTLRVNVVSFGTEFHTFHMHGYSWTDPGTGTVTDSVTVGPGTAYGFTLEALDNPGVWQVHCHVESHTHSMMSWMDVQ